MKIKSRSGIGSYDFESDHEGSSALFKYTQTIPNEVFIPNNPVLERIAIALERIAIALETSKYVASKNNNPYEVTYNKEVKNE